MDAQSSFYALDKIDHLEVENWIFHGKNVLGPQLINHRSPQGRRYSFLCNQLNTEAEDIY